MRINGKPAGNELANILCRAIDKPTLTTFLVDAGLDEINVIAAPDSYLDTSWYLFADASLSPAMGLLTRKSRQIIDVQPMGTRASRRESVYAVTADYEVAPISRVGVVCVSE